MKYLCLAIAAAALFMTGCATAPVPSLSINRLEKSAGVVVEDFRPASESEKKSFSLLVTSEAYAILRVPQAPSDPSLLRLLAHRAFETFPELAESPTIKIHHFVVYNNPQAQLRRGAWGAALGGAVGAALASQSSPPQAEIQTSLIDSGFFQETAAKEHRRAFYTEKENPSKASVSIVYIETELLGRRIASRSYVPPLINSPDPTQGGALNVCFLNHLALYRAAQPATPTTTP